MSLPLPAERLPPPWRDEDQAVAALRAQLSGLLDWSAVREQCTPWVQGVRGHPGPPWALESLLHEFPLNTQEGLGLMRLAEALLRVPDTDTALALTADQLKGGASKVLSGPSAPVEQGLVASLTHRVLDLGKALLPPADHSPQGWLQRLGAPTVVAATVRAVQLLGQQFVLGQDIGEALARARRMQSAKPAQRLCFSFDMLGEGARTWADADRYHHAYRHALEQLAQADGRPSRDHPGPAHPRDGLSIKLSALHPRLENVHVHDVLAHLIPRLADLCELAAQSDLQLTLDAEESWRLELQFVVLDQLLEHLSALGREDPRLAAWQGLGLAIQAYQHRALPSIDEAVRLARAHGRRLTVRLVKGAYWDGELKRAQELGLPGFPVYTHKAHTDLSYLACAHRLLSHHKDVLPQFATHNAATVAAVMQLARRAGVAADRLEWQRLHGMGEATWREILASSPAGASAASSAMALRVYAPVGSHKDLLAYLVRRLLENGANASFVHQLADPLVPLEQLLMSPLLGVPHTGSTDSVAVAPPRLLYGQARPNPWGRDIHHGPHRDALAAAWAAARSRSAEAPATASVAEIDPTMARLQAGLADWEARGSARCQVLESVASRLEQDLDSWAADLVLEGGKCWSDAISEVRETIDYARYYAQHARDWLQSRLMPGPTGERNEWRLRARGVWVCIAPWNFPLAIFGGQVMAALAMGNTVAAKPAEQAPRIARRFTEALQDAGVPHDALSCLCGDGTTIGSALVRHPLCAGVAFTGSVATGLALQRMLSERSQAHPHPIVPLIAETGGLNALIADSTALPEQLLDSVLSSAFGSAGQRCSALRLLCVHTAVADAFEHLLAGALLTIVVGDPAQWQTDVGPVIDERARERLAAHLDALASDAERDGSGVHLIGRAEAPAPTVARAWPFVVPSAWTLPRVSALTDEHFGPVLHVVRWGPGCEADSLDALIDQINATGFGLTLGVHTRIDARAEHVARRARVGNVYVNRGITGAVVGSQPFGGQGLSGTGPKAGGPLYLPRFATEQVVCTNTAAAGGNAALLTNPLTR